jgi:hypothetical protein
MFVDLLRVDQQLADIEAGILFCRGNFCFTESVDDFVFLVYAIALFDIVPRLIEEVEMFIRQPTDLKTDVIQSENKRVFKSRRKLNSIDVDEEFEGRDDDALVRDETDAFTSRDERAGKGVLPELCNNAIDALYQ